MLKIVLIDYDIDSIKILENTLIGIDSSIEILGPYTDTANLQHIIHSHEIDCVFIDYELAEKDAFRMWEQVINKEITIILTHKDSQEVLSGTNKQAHAYLMKPFCPNALASAVETVRRLREEKMCRLTVQAIIQQFSDAHVLHKKIGISVDGKILFLNPSDILYCESDGNYCSIFLIDNKKLFVTKKLKDIHELLPPEIFYRIHHSYVINLNKVQEYIKTDGYVVLEENKRIPVSRQKKASFLALVN